MLAIFLPLVAAFPGSFQIALKRMVGFSAYGVNMPSAFYFIADPYEWLSSTTARRWAMDENKETNIVRNAQFHNGQDHYFEIRLEDDRRSKPSEGFTYISSVGWIDRREKLRRKHDSLNF